MKSFAGRGIEHVTPGELGAADELCLLEAARIAVLIPCFNEAASIAKVVRGFRTSLPSADV